MLLIEGIIFSFFSLCDFFSLQDLGLSLSLSLSCMHMGRSASDFVCNQFSLLDFDWEVHRLIDNHNWWQLEVKLRKKKYDGWYN